MVAAIVVREVLVTGLRQAAIERGVVLAARDLGKLKTWAQAVAAAVAGFAAAGAWTRSRRLVGATRRGDSHWVSGLDYARSAPRLFSRAQTRLAHAAGQAAMLRVSHHSSKRAHARRYSRRA